MKFILVVLILILSACRAPVPTLPDITIINNTTNTNTNGGGNGQNPAGLPQGSLPTGVPATVRVTQFTNTSGDLRSVQVNSTIQLTCTPRKSDGTDYWAGIHDSAIKPPDSFAVIAGSAHVEVRGTSSVGYNLELKGKSPGQALINCTVLGVEGSPVFALTVFQ